MRALARRPGEDNVTVTWDLLDEWIKPYIADLNELDGVTTLQSCAGHEEGETRPASGETFACDGHLWFADDELFTDDLLTRLTLLAGITSVSKLYGREQAPVIEVTFARRQRRRAMGLLLLALNAVAAT
jgi:hypothetical protein